MPRPLVAVCIALLALACNREAPTTHRPPVDQRRSPDSGLEQPAREEPAVRPPRAEQAPRLSTGQALYVPVYSHVYWGEKPEPFNLACTLSIRNIDPQSSITVTAVDYYDTAGTLVGHYLEEDVVLAPLATTEYFVAERDVAGGSGANFIVRWRSPEPVNAPVVEAVMIGVDSGHGISFVSQAREIDE
jgi:hypothetical protein